MRHRRAESSLKTWCFKKKNAAEFSKVCSKESHQTFLSLFLSLTSNQPIAADGVICNGSRPWVPTFGCSLLYFLRERICDEPSSCCLPLLQRKLLAIYLHNDDSVLSNVFCSQMMCADSIISYLSQNFITWAWDVTKEANKARYAMKHTVLLFLLILLTQYYTFKRKR